MLCGVFLSSDRLTGFRSLRCMLDPFPDLLKTSFFHFLKNYFFLEPQRFAVFFYVVWKIFSKKVLTRLNRSAKMCTSERLNSTHQNVLFLREVKMKKRMCPVIFEIVRETEKAYYCNVKQAEFTARFCWIPKSVCETTKCAGFVNPVTGEVETYNTFVSAVAEWFMNKNNLY